MRTSLLNSSVASIVRNPILRNSSMYGIACVNIRAPNMTPACSMHSTRSLFTILNQSSAQADNVSPRSNPTSAASITVDATSALPKTLSPSHPSSLRAVPTAEELLKMRDVPLYDDSYLLPHQLWAKEAVESVTQLHRPVRSLVDFLAYATIKTIRFNFDWMSGWSTGKINVSKAVTRVCFLETVAGVPGSIAATLRHLASLRRMQRDGGWIHTLLEEAENERMHLLVALQLKQPGPAFRALVFVTQGVFYNFFWLAYLVSPKFCHRLVGYLEEEAVVTYTHILEGFDKGWFPEWDNVAPPKIARAYWRLPENSTMRDMFMSIRLDEAHHRDVNHTFADLRRGDLNPFRAGE